MISQDEWNKLNENQKYGILANVMSKVEKIARDTEELRNALTQTNMKIDKHIYGQTDYCPHTLK